MSEGGRGFKRPNDVYYEKPVAGQGRDPSGEGRVQQGGSGT